MKASAAPKVAKAIRGAKRQTKAVHARVPARRPVPSDDALERRHPATGTTVHSH